MNYYLYIALIPFPCVQFFENNSLSLMNCKYAVALFCLHFNLLNVFHFSSTSLFILIYNLFSVYVLLLYIFLFRFSPIFAKFSDPRNTFVAIIAISNTLTNGDKSRTRINTPRGDSRFEILDSPNCNSYTYFSRRVACRSARWNFRI